MTSKPRAKGGRPPVPPEESRRHRVYSNLTDAEKARFDRLRVAWGTTQAETVRRAVLAACEAVTATADTARPGAGRRAP